MKPDHPTPHTSFEALRLPQYQRMIVCFLLTMMADNIEHVVSYWVLFQKFDSPVLGGFAVISHWVPFLVFSLPAGALTDRYDPRRLIQIGMALFMLCSAGWAYMFIADTLEVWAAMCLLVLHGLSGVFWNVATQIILYDLVDKEVLPSAVRTLATARYIGLIVGPGVGGGLMLWLGPEYSLLVNCVLYVPNILWLINAPCGPQFRPAHLAPPARPFRGVHDLFVTIAEVRRNKDVLLMLCLAGSASWFVSNSYQAQMPAYAHDLGHGDPGLTYSLLLAADASGALCAGLLWEYLGQRSKPTARKAMGFALLWAASLGVFALSSSYVLSLIVLFVAGFAELSFNSAAQTIVQLKAPLEIRGRVIGLFNMASLGLRFGSGITVGLLGGVIGNHGSLFVACSAFVCCLAWLQMLWGRRAA
jgi:MFS family permease